MLGTKKSSSYASKDQKLDLSGPKNQKSNFFQFFKLGKKNYNNLRRVAYDRFLQFPPLNSSVI